jgi:hypothetical protein
MCPLYLPDRLRQIINATDFFVGTTLVSAEQKGRMQDRPGRSALQPDIAGERAFPPWLPVSSWVHIRFTAYRSKREAIAQNTTASLSGCGRALFFDF